MDERAANEILKTELKRIINDSNNWANLELGDITLFRVVGVFSELHLKHPSDDQINEAYNLLSNRYEAEISAWLAGYIDQWRVSQRHILGL